MLSGSFVNAAAARLGKKLSVKRVSAIGTHLAIQQMSMGSRSINSMGLRSIASGFQS